MGRSKIKRLFFGLLIVAVVAAAGGGVAWYQFNSQQSPSVPKDVSSQLNFTPFVAKGGAAITQPLDYKYDSTIKLLTYELKINGVKVAISQQSTPKDFASEAKAFEQLSKRMNKTESFKSPHGEVAITYPEGSAGKQTAIMISGGALLFARPEHDLSMADWHRLFDSFDPSP